MTPFLDPNQLKQDSPRKRYRTTFSPSQLKRLEGEFNCNMYVVGLKRLRLAQELKLEERHIKIWFQNRRMKYKRDQRLNEQNAGLAFQNYCFYWRILDTFSLTFQNWDKDFGKPCWTLMQMLWRPLSGKTIWWSRISWYWRRHISLPSRHQPRNFLRKRGR